MPPSQLSKRFCYFDDDCDSYWGSDGYYIRYAIVAAIFVVIVLMLLFAYMHAVRRIKRGQQPLAYHRWLVRRNRYPYGQGQNTTYAYYMQPPQGQQAYPMNGYPQGQGPQPGQAGWAPPPPAYGQHVWDTPPTYAPPTGASKAAANQNVDDMGYRENGEGSASVAAPEQTYHAPPRNQHTQ